MLLPVTAAASHDGRLYVLDAACNRNIHTSITGKCIFKPNTRTQHSRRDEELASSAHTDEHRPCHVFWLLAYKRSRTRCQRRNRLCSVQRTEPIHPTLVLPLVLLLELLELLLLRPAHE